MLIKIQGFTRTPYSIKQLKKDNPNVSFPAEIPAKTLAKYNVYDAADTPRPAYDHNTQRLERSFTGAAPNYAIAYTAVTLQAEDCKRGLTEAVQEFLDASAMAKGYDNILSACTYAASKNGKFSKEGVAYLDWRDDVWTKCIEVLTDVESGARAVPTTDELIAELPRIVW